MARIPERGRRRGPDDGARGAAHKACGLCRDEVDRVDYKDVASLRPYLSDRGRIRARRATGNCERHQHAVSLAVRTAREMALLPYAPRTTAERAGRRGRRAVPVTPAGAAAGGASTPGPRVLELAGAPSPAGGGG